MAKEEATLVETEVQMALAHFAPVNEGVVFDHPLVDHPYVMANDKWQNMGRPVYIRVKVWPVYLDGTPWHS
jgi:hypothetical protein